MSSATDKKTPAKSGSIGKSNNIQKVAHVSSIISNTPNKQSILTPASLLLKPVSTPTSTSRPTSAPTSNVTKKSTTTTTTVSSANTATTIKGGDLIATYTEVFTKGEVKSLCIAQNNIWTGGTDGQLAVYSIQVLYFLFYIVSYFVKYIV